MNYPVRTMLVGFLMIVLLGVPLVTQAAISQDDLGISLTQPDGSRISISGIEIAWAGRSNRSFGIKESGERLLPKEQPRLVAVSSRPLPVSSLWSCDVSGVLSTYSGISRRDGKPVTQRVLIVSPEDVSVYCSSKGRPILFAPGLDTDWPYKRTLADLASEQAESSGSVMAMDELPLPPMPDSPYSSDAVYCETIADAKAQYSSTARNLVELHCRPFSNATSTQFDLGQDSPTDSITAYYSGSSSISGRINKIVGTIQKDEQTGAYWLEVDSGPNWQEGDDIGGVNAIPEGPTIVYARTLQQGATATLTGKVVTANRTDFPDALYVQETDRSAGIRVLYSGTYYPNRSDLVSVTGTIGLGDDGEREIDAGTTGVTYEDEGEAPGTFGMTNRNLGGNEFNALTPGVNNPAGSGTGLYNKSLLVKSWGKVTAVDATNKFFYIDDGTGFADGSGNTGVKISWDWPTAGKPSIMPPAVGWSVSVTGISSSDTSNSGATYYRVLRPRDQNDVVIHQTGAPIVYDPVESWQEEFTPSDSSDTGGTGPSSADSVDLATGAYNNDPDPDIVAVNQLGPDAEFTRLYRSKLAESGIGSAGLSVGWTHNYDVKIIRNEAGWGDLKLVFPDGAADTLQPVLSGGTPTGAFTPMGPSYIVIGEASATPGLWNWIRVTFPDETKWEFTSASGSPYRLRKISDIQGNSIYVNRNVDTSLGSVSTDSAGTSKLLDFSYSSGSLTITDVPSSRSVTLSFVTEAGATVLKSATQISTANLKWRYTYEPIGGTAYLAQVEVPDPTGELTYRSHPIYYDGDGRVRGIKDANNNSRSYVYGQGYTQVYAKNPSGAVVECWTQKIGSNKEDLGVIDANGEETGIEYNTAKRPWRFTNKNAKQSTAVYDDYGNVTHVTDEAGIVTTYGYTDANNPFRLTYVQTTAGSSSKTSTTFEYYTNGLLRYANSPKPGTSNTGERVTTEYIYKTSGNVWKIITPTGLGTSGDQVSTTVYEYENDTDYSYSTTEKLGQPIVISVYEGDPANGKLLSRTHLRYDSRGRLEHVIDPLIGNPPDPADYRDRHKVTLAYNNEDQITDIWYAPTGSSVSQRVHRVYSYNYPGGELTGIELFAEDGTSFRTIGTVSGNESELKEVLGDILQTNQAYDALYRLKEVRDINNHATSFGYDAVGNVSGMRYAGGQQHQWQYDADHNLSKRIDALTRTTNYGYDSTKSYLTSIDYPTGTDASLAYDDFGRLESVTDATGTVSYTYDDNDLVMTATTDYTGSVPSKTITYTYNLDGSRRSMETPAGTFNYQYYYDSDTEQNLIVKTLVPWVTGTTQIQNVYDESGKLIKQRSPRLATTYTYDNRGLMKSLSNAGTYSSYFNNLQYDPAGNLLGFSYNIPTAWTSQDLTGTVDYDYGELDRLVREQRTDSSDPAYSYDVSFSADDADNLESVRGLSLSYNSNNQIVGTSYSYDANGNAIDYRGLGFSYDYEDLPTGVTGGMYGDGSVTMAFRADGLRAWRSSYNGGWFSYYLYDGDRAICELDSNGNLQSDGAYAYGPNGLVLRREVSTANRYVTYAFDPLGSHVQALYFNGSSLSIRRFSIYDAFGKRHWDKTSSGTNTNAPGSVGFAGQWGAYTDHETRPSQTDTPLVLMGIRYYDPITARFVTRDPALGINDYAYCGNNPVGRADADGEILETIADIASIGWSTYDLIKNPSWANAGYLAWDVGATVVPFVPGSYVAKGAKIASKAVHAVHGAKVAKAASKAGKVVKRVVRNPFGKKGGILHQKRVEQIVEDIRRRGLKAETEFGIRTPGARNGKRYADVVATHPKKPGVPLEIHQVGRTNKYGYPVRRETEALHDIRHAKDRQGASMHYHPYDK